MFNYGDGGSHTDSNHTDYENHSDEHLYGDYSERIGHSDCSSQRRSINARHMDVTRHEDQYWDHDDMDVD